MAEGIVISLICFSEALDIRSSINFCINFYFWCCKLWPLNVAKKYSITDLPLLVSANLAIYGKSLWYRHSISSWFSILLLIRIPMQKALVAPELESNIAHWTFFISMFISTRYLRGIGSILNKVKKRLIASVLLNKKGKSTLISAVKI